MHSDLAPMLLAESFNAALKTERVHRTVYPTRQNAMADVARYIELRYNTQRLHLGLGYKTPHEVYAEYWNQQHAAWNNQLKNCPERSGQPRFRTFDLPLVGAVVPGHWESDIIRLIQGARCEIRHLCRIRRRDHGTDRRQ